MSERVVYRIRQDGMTVASVEGPEDRAKHVEREAMHYAAQYAADRLVVVEKRHGKRWRLAFRVGTVRMFKAEPPAPAPGEGEHG